MTLKYVIYFYVLMADGAVYKYVWSSLKNHRYHITTSNIQRKATIVLIVLVYSEKSYFSFSFVFEYNGYNIVEHGHKYFR